MIKRLVISGVGIVLVALCAYAYWLYTSLPTIEERTFASLRDAVSGNAIQDVWMPEFLPPSASEMRMRRGPAPSFVELEFRLDPSDLDRMTRDLMLISDASWREAALAEGGNVRWRRPIDLGSKVYSHPESRRGSFSRTWLLLVAPDGAYAWYLAQSGRFFVEPGSTIPT